MTQRRNSETWPEGCIAECSLRAVRISPELPERYYAEWNRTHTLLVNEDYLGQMPLGMIKIITCPDFGQQVCIVREARKNGHA